MQMTPALIESFKNKVKKEFTERFPKRPLEFMDKDTRDEPDHLDKWEKAKMPIEILLDPAHTTETENWFACFEVGYGHLILFDKYEDELHISKQGIFLEVACCLGDYYGFEDKPAIFERV